MGFGPRPGSRRRRPPRPQVCETRRPRPALRRSARDGSISICSSRRPSKMSSTSSGLRHTGSRNEPDADDLRVEKVARRLAVTPADRVGRSRARARCSGASSHLPPLSADFGSRSAPSRRSTRATAETLKHSPTAWTRVSPKAARATMNGPSCKGCLPLVRHRRELIRNG